MTLHALAALVETATAMAQEPATVASDAVAARPDQVARGFHYLMAAYTAVWVILALYLLSLSIRLRRISAQLRRLKERLGIPQR